MIRSLASLALASWAALTIGCATSPPDAGSTEPEASARVLLFIGQDPPSIQNYVEAEAFPAPGGVVGYASIFDGHGFDGTAPPAQSLGMNLRATLAAHPQAIGMLGLYMVEEGPFRDGLTELTEGLYDAQITRLAEVINESARPVFVRIGYEFDGPWNHYDPARYIAAFRYLVDALRAQSPFFVSVWHGATSPAGHYLHLQNHGVPPPDFRTWYPGDGYVDWVGVSWFLSDLPMQRSLAQTMADFARVHHKPLIVAESSPQGFDLVARDYRSVGLIDEALPEPLNRPGGTLLKELSEAAIWEQWFRPLLTFVEDNGDVVRALCYINTDWDASELFGPGPDGRYPNGYWGDARLEETETLKEIWQAEISQPRWVNGEDVDFADWMPRSAPLGG